MIISTNSPACSRARALDLNGRDKLFQRLTSGDAEGVEVWDREEGMRRGWLQLR